MCNKSLARTDIESLIRARLLRFAVAGDLSGACDSTKIVIVFRTNPPGAR